MACTSATGSRVQAAHDELVSSAPGWVPYGGTNRERLGEHADGSGCQPSFSDGNRVAGLAGCELR